jgi:hypothetical protein
MNGHREEMTVRPWEEAAEDSGRRPSLRHSLVARRRTRQLERLRRADDQWFARRMQDIIVELGLTETNYSISGGYTLHVPQVISMIAGPPRRFDIRILPGQGHEDFAAHAQTIARELDVAEVRVIPLGRSLVRVELLLPERV